eukprot:gene11336-34301_t
MLGVWAVTTAVAAFAGIPLILQFSLGWPQEGTALEKLLDAAHILYSTKASKLDVYHDRPPPPPSDDRNTVDGPKELRPCAIFIHGGAWASGEKSLYSAVGAELVATGFGAVIPDYCKYPDAEMPTIEAELIDCIKWVVAHGGAYGLDATRITLIGHSAGAHICAAVLLSLAAASCNNALIGNGGDVDGTIVHQDEHGDEAEGGYADGNVGKARFLSRIVAFVGAAGVYNIANHFEHEAKRGLEWVSPMHRVMQGKSNFDLHSPAPKVRRLSMLGGGPLDHAALAKLAVLAAGASTAATPAGGRIYLNADADADVNNTSGGNINDGGGGGGGGQLFCKELRAAKVEVEAHIYDSVDHMELLLSFMSDSNGGRLKN